MFGNVTTGNYCNGVPAVFFSFFLLRPSLWILNKETTKHLGCTSPCLTSWANGSKDPSAKLTNLAILEIDSNVHFKEFIFWPLRGGFNGNKVSLMASSLIRVKMLVLQKPIWSLSHVSHFSEAFSMRVIYQFTVLGIQFPVLGTL